MSTAPHQSDYPIKFYNGSGGTIPAFAIMMVTGSEVTNNEFAFQVDQIDIPSVTAGDTLILVNGPLAVDDTKYGDAQWIEKANWFGYTTGDGTPAFGDMWGVQNAQWLLKKNAPGVTIVGQPDTTNGVVQGKFQQVIRRYGETTATFAVATSWETGEQDVTVKIGIKNTGSGGDYTQSTFTITAKNRSEDSSTAATGAFVIVEWDWYALEWVIVWVDCA